LPTLAGQVALNRVDACLRAFIASAQVMIPGEREQILNAWTKVDSDIMCWRQ
jgi:hypothetical protein